MRKQNPLFSANKYQQIFRKSVLGFSLKSD